ncbi:MAG TPA: redoxin domain-containing protein [Candidatus Acidoferrales bacterium]|nr:redoxin domain-containing protein [Candidatus Acidoferrales bacterium]
MLKTRQIIPPLTARSTAGQTVRAGDFKQKKNLVIAFLHANCPRCHAFLGELAVRAREFAEREAVALVVYSETPGAALVGENLPAQVRVAVDMSGRSLGAYLGEGAFGPSGLERVGVFVADRYGELYSQRVARGEDGLPGVPELLEWLAQIQAGSEE